MIKLIKILVGSQNYGLATENSDYDYVIIVLPEFADLYNNIQFNKHIIDKDKKEDIKFLDIRVFINNLINKSNLNILELLYSRKVEIFDRNEYVFEWYQNLINMRDKIANIDIDRLLQSTIGEINGYISKIEKNGYNKKIYIRCAIIHALCKCAMLSKSLDFQLGAASTTLEQIHNEMKDASINEAIELLNYYVDDLSHTTIFIRPSYDKKQITTQIRQSTAILIKDILKENI